MLQDQPLVKAAGSSDADREAKVCLSDGTPATALNPQTPMGDSSKDWAAAERATAERAVLESQRLISIGRLSAEIVHEINNPLESVGNLLYLALHEAGMPERALEFLRSADSELQRVVQITKQTLGFSRESTVPVPVHPADLMNEVVSMYARRIREKRLHLVEDYSTSEVVLAVPGEIRQIFSNIVTNAIEASAQGGKLAIRFRDAKRGTVRGIRLTVCDNGVGIAEAARKRIGEIFFTTKGDTGTGLGLWVTKSIVTRYGGTMRLHSSTGKHHGTSFSIFLPAAGPSIPREDKFGQRLQASGNVTEISRHPKHATHLLNNLRDALPEPGTRQRNG